MTPWTRRVEIGPHVLLLGDCLAILPQLEPACAVVTDPPYVGLSGGFVHVKGGVGTGARQDSASVGDEWAASHDWVPMAEKLARKALIAFCGHADVASFRAAATLPGWLVTWYRRNSPAARKGVVRFNCEYIWALRAGGACSWHQIDTVIDVPAANAGCASSGERLTGADGRALHPTQKPIALMRQLILPEFASVIDPFMGTATTGLACIQAGARFVGIERDPKHFDLAVRRVSEAYAQPDFLTPAPPPAPVQEVMPL